MSFTNFGDTLKIYFSHETFQLRNDDIVSILSHLWRSTAFSSKFVFRFKLKKCVHDIPKTIVY